MHGPSPKLGLQLLEPQRRVVGRGDVARIHAGRDERHARRRDGQHVDDPNDEVIQDRLDREVGDEGACELTEQVCELPVELHKAPPATHANSRGDRAEFSCCIGLYPAQLCRSVHGLSAKSSTSASSRFVVLCRRRAGRARSTELVDRQCSVGDVSGDVGEAQVVAARVCAVLVNASSVSIRARSAITPLACSITMRLLSASLS